jgi:phosphatidylserine/phosphatidylglycerophosphate/cardiolipin synthase-like enzyme
MRSAIQPKPAALFAMALAAVSCGAAATPAGLAPKTHAYPTAAAGPFVVGPDRVTVLPRGEVAFPIVLSLLKAADRGVVVEMYELQRGDLISALIDVQARGIPVTVITDPGAAGSEAAAMLLRSAGVDVAEYPVRKLTIDHVKLLVVDGEVAVVGGINWGTASAAHHDFDILVRGPVVANLERVADRDLVTCGHHATVPPLQIDTAITVASTLPFDEVRPVVLAGIEAATRSLDLELYVLTDLGLVHALERAHARGVAIRLLLDPSQRPSDVAAAELRASRVPLRLYAAHGELLHAKAMVIDQRTVLFGSANWSGGGFSRNHEIDVVIHESRAVASAFLAAIDADWDASVPPP